jgi:SAM-dependent methyltransferase
MTYAPYNKNAKKFFSQYQSLIFDQVHGDWLPQLDGKTGLALDVGAGSGRDAAALTERGWDVVAVEPAVWMHIPPTARERAFRILIELLAPGGMLVVTLRHGPGDGERVFYDVSREEVEAFAKRRALIPVVLSTGRNDDELKRSEVSWETLAFRLADDGTGALPTVRHIIVNDNKSSTYKLGLLRALVRIADGAPVNRISLLTRKQNALPI